MFTMTDAYLGGCQIHLKCQQCELSLWTEVRPTEDRAGEEAAVYDVLHESVFPDHVLIWAIGYYA